MSLEDIATINVSSSTAGVTRAGYGVPLLVSHTASWAERVRSYTSADTDDFEANTPEALYLNAVFSQRPKIRRAMIGRAALTPTQQFGIGAQSVSLAQEYSIRLAVPTGVVMPDQDATYNSGGGATGWRPSNTWSQGDVVVADGAKMYVNLGPSAIAYENGMTGIGAASGPSGTSAAIREGGTYWMYCGSGATGGILNDAIVVGLASKIRALGAPTAVASGGTNQLQYSYQGSQGSRTLRLTANTAGKYFGIQVYNRDALNIAQDHSDPGIATDLAAIKLANNDWYGLITAYNSKAYVVAAAEWVESNKKLYAAGSIDSTIARDAESVATDVAHTLKGSAYARSFVVHHPSNDEFADAAEMARFFAVAPGGETWRMKTLSGPTGEAYTDTEQTNMKAKYAHFYYELGGDVNAVGGDGKTASGEYVDVTRFLDWYESELQADLVDLALNLDKIPFTNAGIDMVEARVRKMNKRGIAAGGIREGTDEVEAPDVADVDDSDRAARELPDVNSSFELAGAIHHITVNVSASV